MKKLSVTLFACCLLASVASTKNHNTIYQHDAFGPSIFSDGSEIISDTIPEETEKKMPGSGRDAHGCNPSAGFSWSQIQQKCLRLFKSAIRLNPVNNTSSAVISAFAVISKDKKKAEVFVPADKFQSVVLTRKKVKGNLPWTGGGYTLSLNNGTYLLDINKTKSYSSAL